MPDLYHEISFQFGTKSEYNSLDSYNPNALYFIVDTNQIYIGSTEYSRSVQVLDEVPTEDTIGIEGNIYYVPNSKATYIFVDGTWAQVFDPNSSIVSKIIVGDGLESDNENNIITGEGAIFHKVPQGAEQRDRNSTNNELKLGDSFTFDTISTDKYGHVVGFCENTFSLPNLNDLDTVFRLKGILPDVSSLPQQKNLIGDTYYIESESRSLTYINEDMGWKPFGYDINPIPRVLNSEGMVPTFQEDGTLAPLYESIVHNETKHVGPISTDDIFDKNKIDIPSIDVDIYGRSITLQDIEIPLIDKQTAEDLAYWISYKYINVPVRGMLKSEKDEEVVENQRIYVIADSLIVDETYPSSVILTVSTLPGNIERITVSGEVLLNNLYTVEEFEDSQSRIEISYEAFSNTPLGFIDVTVVCSNGFGEIELEKIKTEIEEEYEASFTINCYDSDRNDQYFQYLATASSNSLIYDLTINGGNIDTAWVDQLDGSDEIPRTAKVSEYIPKDMVGDRTIFARVSNVV